MGKVGIGLWFDGEAGERTPCLTNRAADNRASSAGMPRGLHGASMMTWSGRVSTMMSMKAASSSALMFPASIAAGVIVLMMDLPRGASASRAGHAAFVTESLGIISARTPQCRSIIGQGEESADHQWSEHATASCFVEAKCLH